MDSTNWTISSRAKRECGVLLRFSSNRAKAAKVVCDWVADFDAAHESGITVQAAVEGRELAGLGTASPVSIWLRLDLCRSV